MTPFYRMLKSSCLAVNAYVSRFATMWSRCTRCWRDHAKLSWLIRLAHLFNENNIKWFKSMLRSCNRCEDANLSSFWVYASFNSRLKNRLQHHKNWVRQYKPQTLLKYRIVAGVCNSPKNKTYFPPIVGNQINASIAWDKNSTSCHWLLNLRR